MGRVHNAFCVEANRAGASDARRSLSHAADERVHPVCCRLSSFPRPNAVVSAMVILFDRDGTLIVDHSGDADPERVQMMPRVGDAFALIREWNWRIGVVTNQPRDVVSSVRMQQIHARIESIAGAIDGWFVCTHQKSVTCACRKPAPGLVLEAARYFRVPTSQCVVVGDIGSDMEAAYRAGARGIMVPNQNTRKEEIAGAPAVAADVLRAVHLVLGRAA
jgi:D-glycero-D-manno-heptose 1,7-bisphosphate phosphatase